MTFIRGLWSLQKKYNEGREAFAKIEEGFAGGEDEAATTKKYSIEKLKDQFYVLDQDLNYIRGIRTGNYSTTLGDYLKNNGFHPDAGPIRLPAIETAEVITCIGQICDYVGEFIGEFNSRGPDLSVDFEEYKFTERYALCKEKLKTIGYYPIDEVVDEELLPSDIA